MKIDSAYCDIIVSHIEQATDEEDLIRYLQSETMTDLNRVLWLVVYRLWKRTEAK